MAEPPQQGNPPGEIPVAAHAASDFSAADDAAMQLIQAYRGDELKRVQGRADKWVAGLGAIVGVLTTAIVIKGPDTFTNLTEERDFYIATLAPKDVIIVLMVLGGLALSVGIYYGYQAANGSPLQDSEIEKLAAEGAEVHGAADKWRDAVATEITSAQDSLRSATVSTILGGVLLAAAILVTWTTPVAADSTTTCVQTASGITKYDGTLPPVVSGSVTVAACPPDPAA